MCLMRIFHKLSNVINLTCKRHRREFHPLRLIPVILQFKTNTLMSRKNCEIWVPVALCLVYPLDLVLRLSVHSAIFFRRSSGLDFIPLPRYHFCNACKTEQV